MAPQVITEHHFKFDSGKTRYLAAGPKDGPLLIFMHGWIAVSETWEPQLLAFAARGFRVIAPDTRGYGGSTATKHVRDYRLEQHVIDMLALLKHLERKQAVWIGHDWGCGLVWALVAHHPEVCVGVVCMTVPYRVIELGLDALVATVNRDIYPVDKYPLGQWDYQAFHQEQQERSAATLDADPYNTFTALYQAGKPETYGTPAFTASVRENGGWWGKEDSAPKVPVEDSLLKDYPHIHKKLIETLKVNGSFGPNAYYLNHDVNNAYSRIPISVNDGILKLPVLFIEARYDGVCDTALSSFAEPMRKICTALTETTINAGHWVAFEKPAETNAAIEKWLATKIPTYCPSVVTPEK